MTIEELQAKLKEQEGLLTAEKAKVTEFRDDNVKLTKSVDELNKKFGAVDIDEYDKLQKQAKEAKDENLNKSSDIEKLIAKFDTFKAEQEKKQKVLETNNALLAKENEKAVIDSAIKSAAIKAGVSKTALDDVVARANVVWTVKNGKPVALDKDGTAIWIKDTTEPLTVDKWVVDLNQTAPHLFSASEGTNAKNPKFDPNIKTATRSAFDAMTQKARATFSIGGGKVVD